MEIKASDSFLSSARGFYLLKIKFGDFPGGPVVENLPSNAGAVGSILDPGTKIPHAMGQLSLSTATREVYVLL